MAGNSNIKQKVNLGLDSISVDGEFQPEANMWYNNVDGNIKCWITNLKANVGPDGAIPQIYNLANGWYPVQPGGGTRVSTTATNNRAFAYPLYPGRKCTLTDFAVRINDVPGTGNLRMALYGALPTMLPGNLITDYGTKGSLTATTTITSWGVSTQLQPVLYWLVLAIQTSVPPSMISQTFHSPLVPEIAATASFGATQPGAALYTDTGFSGAAPASFGTALTTSDPAPFIFCKLTQ